MSADTTETYPEVPAELFLPENFDILAELTDHRFKGRKHYNKSLYRDGCHGPLCLKKERDAAREARERAARDAGRDYQPGRTPRNDAREELLESVIAWHHAVWNRHRTERQAKRERDALVKKLAARRAEVSELETKLEELIA